MVLVYESLDNSFSDVSDGEFSGENCRNSQ